MTKEVTLLKQFFFHCPVVETREAFSQLLVHVISLVSPRERNNYMEDLPQEHMEVDKPKEKQEEDVSG